MSDGAIETRVDEVWKPPRYTRQELDKYWSERVDTIIPILEARGFVVLNKLGDMLEVRLPSGWTKVDKQKSPGLLVFEIVDPEGGVVFKCVNDEASGYDPDPVDFNYTTVLTK